MSAHAADELRAYATEGIARTLADAEEEWTARREELRRRIAAIDEADGRICCPGDREQDAERRELLAERRVTGGLLSTLSRAAAHGALVGPGSAAQLQPDRQRHAPRRHAVLEGDRRGGRRAGGKPSTAARCADYERSRKLALTELAPGNSFYVNGYKHVVRALDVGSPERRAWPLWRLCPGCGYVRTENAQEDTSPCPRCGSREIADAGCVQHVLQPRRVLARDKRDDARVRDDRDERDRRTYAVLDTVDIDPRHLAAGVVAAHERGLRRRLHPPGRGADA